MTFFPCSVCSFVYRFPVKCLLVSFILSTLFLFLASLSVYPFLILSLSLRFRFTVNFFNFSSSFFFGDYLSLFCCFFRSILPPLNHPLPSLLLFFALLSTLSYSPHCLRPFTSLTLSDRSTFPVRRPWQEKEKKRRRKWGRV